MTCCKCNRTGTCKNCSCVKKNSRCTNCLPCRLNKCANISRSSTDDIDNIPETQGDPESVSDISDGGNDPTNQQSPTNAHHDDQCKLPDPSPIADPSFSWGNFDSETIIAHMKEAYDEVVHWKMNLFLIPFGSVGKSFITELARLYRAVATSSAQESIALKASTVLTVLALQKPYPKSKAKVHVKYLERRMQSWSDGLILDLLAEGRTIQKRTFKGLATSAGRKAPSLARSFAKQMFQGKCHSAFQLLEEESGSAGVLGEDHTLPSGQTVSEVLQSKHPAAQGLKQEALLSPDTFPPLPDQVIFECIDADLIRHAAKQTNGSAGPSGLNAHAWRRMCCSFKEASDGLCHSLALLARRLCTQFIHPSILAPLLACRLVALDKNPGVRPIGVCEVARRIISKAILFVIKGDIQDAAGSRQLCGGQIAGIEAAVHSVRKLFDNDTTEAILLVDANNAFNSLNRANALMNIRTVCPAFSTILINIYRESTELFLGANTLFSQEGTTQGDPLAMPFYALATRPLIDSLSRDTSELRQIWYADDASAGGKLTNLKKWWDNLSREGPSFGYFVNPQKTWLVTKDNFFSSASAMFDDTMVNITTDGRPVPGSPVGKPDYIADFVSQKVKQWVGEIEKLAKIADSQPHAAYGAITHGLSSKWSYLSRTTPDIDHLLVPIEASIRTTLLPKLTGHDAPNDVERRLFSLPARLGGLNITDPSSFANEQFNASQQVTKPLVDLILSESQSYPYEVLAEQIDVKSTIKSRRRHLGLVAAQVIRESLTPPLQLAMDLAQEKGASSWLTALPLEEHGFTLHKSAFRDAMALRYGWIPTNIPSHCVCGQPFSVQHALSCPRGGFPSIRHNELRDLTASLLKETCHGVATEPSLQPITSETFNAATVNTQDGARLDIVANGFWGGAFERAFFDVRVFNPFAPSNRHSSLASSYRHHESLKKRLYERRVREVEHSSFTPLVFSLTGGLGPAATAFYKRLASQLSDKWKQPYSSTIGWLRCRISFSLLRSSIMCLRGARSSHTFNSHLAASVDLTISDSNLSL